MPFREDLKPERILALEEEVLAKWDREKTFERVVETRRSAPPWVFYEGPPTANGKPGLHHVLSRGIKDLACRLKTMQGFLVERKGGWDTHGLPVEIEAEKRLGIEGKRQIEEYGIARFNEECRRSVFRYLDDWNLFTRRMGYWVDLEHPYITCSNDYVESLWWILAQLHRRGLLFRGHKVLPYCPRCSTPLSSHEVGLGFKDVQDPSVFVRFPLEDGSGALLVWTTTPWTLPANVAVAAHPDVDYVQVEVGEGASKERLWLAAARVEALKAPHRVLATVKGRDLLGRRYRRPVPWYEASSPKAFTVLAGDFVSTEEGTGLVHVAPAYGEDDHALGKREGLPVLHPIDAQGRFREGSPVAGRFVKDADKDVVRFLKDEGLLYRRETVVHSYPHCWRCWSPLLYYARDSWYLRTTQFKDRMVELNAKIAWVPDAVGRGRFGQWLENNVDWAISRDRYWGTPLPVWVCDACRREHAVESVAELERLSGRRLEDLHRPFVDEPAWSCAKDGCGGTMRRTSEVADVWFDSGSMPFAQWHYPFENVEKAERSFPAEFIAEAVDQTRGWFYTLLAVSTMLRNESPYRSCVSAELILDEQGKKMSKSRGNIVDPMATMGKFGADVLRWHLLARPLGVPLRYAERDLVEIRNRFFGTLLNVYQFFATYANADRWSPDASGPGGEPSPFDRWLLSRLRGVVEDVTKHLEVGTFDTGRAGQRIAEFVVEDLSNWYVRRNRARFWASGMDADKANAYRTLHLALLMVSKLTAPFAPFLSEALYGALGGPGPSVHAAKWPAARAEVREAALEAGMEAVRRVVACGHAARDKAKVRVRQPLSRLSVFAPGLSPEARAFLEANRSVVLEELNVKALEVLAEEPRVLRPRLNKAVAGPRQGPRPAAVPRAVEARPPSGLADLAAPLRLSTDDGPVNLAADEYSVEAVDPPGTAAQYDRGHLVLLDLRITPELEAEGLAREVTRRLNEMRKKMDLKVEDRVRVRWRADEKAAAALRTWSDWIRGEVLAESFEEAEDGLDPLEVPGHDVRASVARA